MNKLATLNQTRPLVMPDEQTVIELCAAAAEKGLEYACKAVIAGFALLEYRAFLGSNGRTSHSGTSSLIHGRNQHSEGVGFDAWLRENHLAKSTAHRWMEAAEAVARLLMRVPTGHPWAPVIEVEGEVISISQAMSAPEAELPPPALEFRTELLEFMADKTIADALSAAIDGDSPASRIARAGNGKHAGGHHGEDRKDFVLFGARALKNFLAHVGARDGKQGGHFEALSPTQRNQVCEYVGLTLKGMPDEMLEYARDAAAQELKERSRGGKPEPLALKAALTKQEARRK